MGIAFDPARRSLLIAASSAAAMGGLGGICGRLGAAEAWQRPGGLVPPGEWWAGGGPRTAPSSVQIADAAELGERLILSGRLVDRHERPLPDVTVYVYQTDAQGLYHLEGRQSDGPRIRGWARTDAHGRYEFATIRPAHYPGRRVPEHIHMTVSSDSMREWWLPEVRFEGDRFITPDEYERSRRDGPYGNVRRLERGTDEALRCHRNVRL